MQLILLPVLAFCLVLLLHVFALVAFPRWKLLDFPERYGYTRNRLPYPTGVLAVISLLALSPALFSFSEQSAGLLIAITILALTCFVDDRIRLSPLPRLLVQAGVGIVIFLTGTRIFSLTNPLAAWTGMDVIPLDTLSIPSPLFSNPSLIGLCFTVVWLMLTMNALNWLDGIAGQVSVLSFIGFVVIGFLCISSRVHQPELALISFTIAGIALGSSLFDIGPRVIPGDTGAMFYGLLLGTLTIYAGGKVATAFLVLGVPLVDSILVIIRRILKGKSPLKGSMAGEHLHHRLQEAGWSNSSIIALTALIGTGFGATALFLSTLGKFIAGVILFLVMLSLSFYADRKRTSTAKK